MAELAQISVTDDNLKCLDKLKASGYFDELQEAARFAAALAIRKKLFLNTDLSKISGKHTRWNTSLVDPDNFLRNIVKLLGLCPSDYGIGLRSLIILGLDYIYNKIKNVDAESTSIIELLND